MTRLLAFKKISALVLVIVFTIFFDLLPLAKAYACSDAAPCKPFFKVSGADGFVGGWFNDSSGSCDLTNYQNRNYQGDDRNGGILAFAKSDSGGNATWGANGQYAAFALGTVQSSANGQDPFYGFYSRGVKQASPGAAISPDDLTFASNNGSNWGGFFEGASGFRASPPFCITDSYDPVPASAQALPGGDLKNASCNQSYTVSGGANLTASGPVGIPTDPSGCRITIYANGSYLYIGNNITYNGGYTAENPPKLKVIAKGNIMIDPNVSRLDGWYIAQTSNSSTPSSNDGIFWTCHDKNNNAAPVDFASPPYNGCVNSQLTVNGAVTAKQINLTRTSGDINNTGSGPAEIFNYSPEVVMGGGFSTNTSSSSGSTSIDGIISLPPVF